MSIANNPLTVDQISLWCAVDAEVDTKSPWFVEYTERIRITILLQPIKRQSFLVTIVNTNDGNLA